MALRRPTAPLENALLPHATPSDESLVADAAGGHTGAFALLVERHAAGVLAVAARAMGDHHLAHDLTQEIWIKVHRGLPRFDLARRFRPWLYTIAMNHVRDNQRAAGRRAERFHLEDLPLEFPARTEDSMERREQRERIASALARVPEPYQSAVHMVDVVGLGYEEAARSLGCSKGTVKSRVHRGRQAFQVAFLSREDGPSNTQGRGASTPPTTQERES